MVEANREKEAQAKDTIQQLKLEISNLTRLVEQGAGLNLGPEETARALEAPGPPFPSLSLRDAHPPQHHASRLPPPARLPQVEELLRQKEELIGERDAQARSETLPTVYPFSCVASASVFTPLPWSLTALLPMRSVFCGTARNR